MRKFHLGRLCTFSACYNRMLPRSGWTARRGVATRGPRRCGLRETSNECGQSNETINDAREILWAENVPIKSRECYYLWKGWKTIAHALARRRTERRWWRNHYPATVNAKSVITTHLVLSFCSHLIPKTWALQIPAYLSVPEQLLIFCLRLGVVEQILYVYNRFV